MSMFQRKALKNKDIAKQARLSNIHEYFAVLI